MIIIVLIILGTGVLGGLGAIFGDCLAEVPVLAVSARGCRLVGATLFAAAFNALYLGSLGVGYGDFDIAITTFWGIHTMASSIGVALGSTWVEPDCHGLRLVAGPMLGYLPFSLVSLFCLLGLTII